MVESCDHQEKGVTIIKKGCFSENDENKIKKTYEWELW